MPTHSHTPTARAPRLLSRHRRRNPASATPQGQLAHERYLRDVRQVARLLAWHGLDEGQAAPIVRVYKPADHPDDRKWGTAYPRLCAWFAAGLVTDSAAAIQLGEDTVDLVRDLAVYEPVDLSDWMPLALLTQSPAPAAQFLAARVRAAKARGHVALAAWQAENERGREFVWITPMERPIVDLAEALKVSR